MLYEVAIVERVKEKENLLLKPTPILARDRADAAMKAGQIAPKPKSTQSTTQVLIRPFVES